MSIAFGASAPGKPVGGCLGTSALRVGSRPWLFQRTATCLIQSHLVGCDHAVLAASSKIMSTMGGLQQALARSPQRIQLVRPATAREIATLAAPSPSAITALCFSPDSSRLGVANGREGVHLWDLRAIRQQLAALGLDWNLPPYPLAKKMDTAKPTPVEVLQ